MRKTLVLQATPNVYANNISSRNGERGKEKMHEINKEMDGRIIDGWEGNWQIDELVSG